MHGIKSFLQTKRKLRHKDVPFCQRWHLDLPLTLGLLILVGFGLIVLYSSSNQDYAIFERQLIHLGIAFFVMLCVSQISPATLRRAAPWLFIAGCIVLLGVLFIGYTGKGAQRWLNLGFIRFQPSEILKIATPLIVAWFISKHHLPPKKTTLLLACVLIIIPMVLIVKQPDLGTALMIGFSGASVLLLAGMSWRLILGILVAIAASLPILWHFFMHPYQRQRVLTLLDPQRDPLGSGYHIIQSKIAIGSGGIYGKGWLNGTQSHLNFIPEHTTDFIYAVTGEEFGLIGSVVLIFIYLFITGRCLYISSQTTDNFSRLVAGSLGLTFFVSTFINIAMVLGILPVVGLPLPLISYGGTSMVTMMATFGIIISIYTHRQRA